MPRLFRQVRFQLRMIWQSSVRNLNVKIMACPPVARPMSQVRLDFGNTKKHFSMPSFLRSMSPRRSCFQIRGGKYSVSCTKSLPISSRQPLKWDTPIQRALPAVPAKRFFARITQNAAYWLKATHVAILTTPVSPCLVSESMSPSCCRRPAGIWTGSPAILIRMMCRLDR